MGIASSQDEVASRARLIVLHALRSHRAQSHLLALSPVLARLLTPTGKNGVGNGHDAACADWEP